MATLSTFFRRTDQLVGVEAPAPRRETARTIPDPFQLRSLPQEDVVFFCKKIDNSRLVREADPRARGACWSAIGAAGIVLIALTGVLAPSVASTLAGLRLDSLRAEEHRLTDARGTLILKEAALLSPERLERLAQDQKLLPPSPSQVVHLDDKPSAAVAMVKQQ